ncbi:hypothetical protein [Tunturiibacter psychrotolerans]|uniref:hypothetical protein n=1 Tax=Tunturiibacter psychrotolerans TaxID=3069686 RepID=UPI003D23B166
MKLRHTAAIVLVLWTTGAGFAQTKQKPSTTRASLSGPFRTKAWRAMDAIFDAFGDSVNGKEVTDSTMKSIKDTFNEAKYVAQTFTDKHLLEILSTSIGSLTWQRSRDRGSVEWKIERDRGMQCHIEAVHYISPDDLSPEGIETALEGTCTKATKEWGEPY